MIMLAVRTMATIFLSLKFLQTNKAQTTMLLITSIDGLANRLSHNACCNSVLFSMQKCLHSVFNFLPTYKTQPFMSIPSKIIYMIRK